MSKRRMLVGCSARTSRARSRPRCSLTLRPSGIDGYYHLLDADRLPGRSLPQLFDAIKTAGFAGANVTYPFKQEIMPLLDRIDPEAAQTGAINTVAIAPDGRTTGYNLIAAAGGTASRNLLAADGHEGRRWCSRRRLRRARRRLRADGPRRRRSGPS